MGQLLATGASVAAHQGEGLIGIHMKAFGQDSIGLLDGNPVLKSCCELVR